MNATNQEQNVEDVPIHSYFILGGIFVMARTNTRRRADRRWFRRTAVTRKKININPVIPRGGIRL